MGVGCRVWDERSWGTLGLRVCGTLSCNSSGRERAGGRPATANCSQVLPYSADFSDGWKVLHAVLLPKPTAVNLTHEETL